MGSLSHTKYHLRDFPERVTVTRPHHPLLNQQLEVLRPGGQWLVVRLPDGTAMKIPRSWTDADGPSAGGALSGSEVFTVEAYRELLALIDALKART